MTATRTTRFRAACLATALLLASPVLADNTMMLGTFADYTDLLNHGTTRFDAVVANLPSSTGPLDWSVTDNGTAGLTLSGSGSALPAGGMDRVIGSYTASAYGTVLVTARATGNAANSPLTAGTSVNVGNATAHDSYTPGSYTEAQFHSFGVPLRAKVSVGASYAPLASRVVALEGGGTDFLGTEAVLRAGIAPRDTTVSMAWRNRTDIEVDGRAYPKIGLQWPPLAWDSYNIISDVVRLRGVQGAYVLEMTYDEPAIIYDPGSTERLHADLGMTYLGWFEQEGLGVLPGRDEWVNAVDGNSATGPKAVANYHGPFDEFLTDHPDFNLPDYLGSWGVDIEADVVWAALDHTSELAVVPEPATTALLALGAAFLRKPRRRRHPSPPV